MSNAFTQVNLLLGVFLVRRRLFRFLLWTLRFPALHHFFCCYLNLSWRWGISAFALRFFITCLRAEKFWLSLVLLFPAFEQAFDSETQKCCFPWANFLLQCLKNEQSIKGKHCGFKRRSCHLFLVQENSWFLCLLFRFRCLHRFDVLTLWSWSWLHLDGIFRFASFFFMGLMVKEK